MENEKQIGSSSPSSSSSYSSFTTDLFGAKESSSTGSFASIFPPPSTVARRNSTNSEFRVPMQKQPSGSQVWSANQGTPENLAKDSEGASHSVNKERRSIFQEREDSCPLGSSLYYGGQEDMYVQSSSAQTSESYPNFKKDGGEDDPNENNLHSASRGNWWQGSLYY